jgi:branched-chain amino acid transport system permease protein
MTSGGAVVHLLLGLGPGAVYAALGLGLFVMHRGVGVLNLAFGAMAMYPAYVYATMRSSGDLVLPGVPGTHHLADQVPALPAAVVALVVSALLGLVTYVVVFRPLRSAPPLASVVGSVGVLLTLQSAVVLRFGGDPRLVEPLLPRHQLQVAGSVVPADRLYLLALVVLTAMGAWLMFRHTRFGLSSRAAAENEAATELMGISPARLGAVNWVIGAVIAGAFGILLAPIAGLSANGYSLLVVPAFVAALAGRLVSVAATVAGGLALGVAQSEATLVDLPWDWASPQTLKEVVPVLALVGVVLAFGTSLPARGTEVGARLPPAPTARRPLLFGAAVIVAGSVAAVTATGPYRSAVAVSLIGTVLCLSIVILTGFAGQVSLAQMTFAGLGAVVLSRAGTDWHVPFPLGAVVGALVAAGVGVLLGLATSRSRGTTVALVSLGAALAVEDLVFRHLSRGLFKSDRIGPPRAFGLELAATGSDGRPRATFVLLLVAVVATVAVGVMQLRNSGMGRRMLAVRSNERAAAASGVNVRRTRLAAFALSGFVAGIGGALLGYHQNAISGQSFALSRSLLLLAAAYIGGVGTVIGAFLGGLIMPGGVIPTAADSILHLGAYTTLFTGIVLTTVVVRKASSHRSRSLTLEAAPHHDWIGP